MFWYNPHYFASMENQQTVMELILGKDPAELFYTERSVFERDVNTKKNWTFVSGKRGDSLPTYVIVVFQARNETESQQHNNSAFDWLQVSNAVCKIGSEK